MPLALLLTLAAVFLLGGGAIAWTVLGGGSGSGSNPTRAPVALAHDPPAAATPPIATPTPPIPTPPTPPPSAASTTGGEPEDTSAGLDADDTADAGALPDTLASADFRRALAPLQRSLASRCPGLPGFEVGLKVYVEASGKVARVVPEGRQAGSSFSACVVKLVRPARFKKARKESVHSATFKL